MQRHADAWRRGDWADARDAFRRSRTSKRCARIQDDAVSKHRKAAFLALSQIFSPCHRKEQTEIVLAAHPAAPSQTRPTTKSRHRKIHRFPGQPCQRQRRRRGNSALSSQNHRAALPLHAQGLAWPHALGHAAGTCTVIPSQRSLRTRLCCCSSRIPTPGDSAARPGVGCAAGILSQSHPQLHACLRTPGTRAELPTRPRTRK